MTYFIDISMPGQLTMVKITKDGTFLEPYAASDPAGNLSLVIDSGTKVTCEGEEIPEKLDIRLAEELPPVPEGIAILGSVYDLTAYASGGEAKTVTFDPPATLFINYDPENLPENALSVFIAYYDPEEGWIQIEPPSGFVAEVGKGAAQVSHFTPFAIMADLPPPPGPARFELRTLDIYPKDLSVGESINIYGQLINIGGLSGEYVVTVKIGGMLETSQVIRLAPRQSQEIGFTLNPCKPGIYQVEIGDLRGSFTVEGIPAPTPTPPSPAPEAEAVGYSWLIIVLSVAAVVVLTFTTVTVRRRLQRAPELPGGWFGRYVRTTLRVPVIERPLKPAVRPVAISAFRIGNLRIDSERVRPGESVTIVASATCIAKVKSSCSVVLRIQGIVEAVKEITLRPGQSQKMAFTILKDKPGAYDISLEDSTGSFVVEEISTPLPPPALPPKPTTELGVEVISRFMASAAT
ncbi:MAG: hypothetical protein KAT75_10770, partial [Dehalococcoidia bacterium]|nr:hypothetical protein [Dehalococcoidia bacterium]